MSKIQNLNDNWYIVKDGENIGKTNNYFKSVISTDTPCKLPSIIQQYFPNYHGVAWYYNEFTPTLFVEQNNRILLNFGGADYKADVWLNGTYLGTEEGGETPFTFDVTSVIKLNAKNLLAVRVVNPTETPIDGLTFMNIPHRNKEVEKKAGCNLNHGGLWYGVNLTAVPNAYISDKFVYGDINGNLTAEVTIDSKNDIDNALITVNVYESDAISALVATNTQTYSVIKGEQTFALNLNVANVKLWSLEVPYLYRVEIKVDTIYGSHTQILKFGFREFKVKNGYFYLNGKKIFLKSAHTGNAYPVGQMIPVQKEQLRQDFIYAKASGFNCLRAISGLFRPEHLDFADEIGMLTYEECFASWCMGYSAVDKWADDTGYIEMQKRHPVWLGSQQDMVEKWNNATIKMLKRDRNHTSLVIWGLLNETYESCISKAAIAFLPTLREYDKSRLVLLSSGRWEKDFTVGSVSNPNSNKWENVWGNDGDEETIKNPNADLVGDLHCYPVAPLNEESQNKIRNFGYNTKYPIFFSEFGVGAQYNVIEEYRHFTQYGYRTDLEDSAWLKLQADEFESDFYRLGLNKIYPFPESLLKDSQRINADERKRHFDLIRSNPRICGYSLTGLLDHGNCGEGLWSFWRRWKPEMFDAVSEGWANLRFCNFVDINSYSGNEITFESVLANDGILKTGTYTANFAIIDDYTVYHTFTETFSLNGNDFATPIFKRKIKLNLPEGKYYFTAELVEGSPVATTTHFYVYDNVKYNGKSVYGYGLTQLQIQNLNGLGIEICNYNDQTNGLVLVGNDNVDANKVIDIINNGSTVILLDNGVYTEENINAFKKVVNDFKITNHRDWLYHKEYVLQDREVFNGLGNRILELARFVKEFPHLAINTSLTPSNVICPGFLTGFYGVKTGYQLNYGMAEFNYGKGKIIFNTFEILNNLGSPVADKLLINLIKKLNN